MRRPWTRSACWLAPAWLVCALGGCPERDDTNGAQEKTAPAPSPEPVADEPRAEPPRASRPHRALLALGAAHTCVAEPGDAVRCWGSNRFGQLGSARVASGPDAHRATPVAVDGLSDVIALAAGSFHTCAADRDGRVHCWGHGVHSGTRSHGTSASEAASKRWPRYRDVPTPQPVEGVQEAVAVAAGEGFTCALVGGQDVECWGRNDLGQLGRATAGVPGVPGEVVGVAGADAVVAGRQHACALVGGTPRCWGMAVDGQLGDSVDTAYAVTPVSVETSKPVRALSAGGYHTCALVGRRGHCFGANDSGQLGTEDGGRPDDRRAAPEAMAGEHPIEAMAAGARFTCVLRADGRVACTGYNAHGQLGDGTDTQRRTVVEVEGLREVSAVSAGAAHACAIHTDGAVSCWGRNGAGQLGDGTTEDRATPVTVDR